MRLDQPIALTKDETRRWISDDTQWPHAETYDPESLTPSTTLERRLASLREIAPAWFWEGDPEASLLSIGTGKGYMERAHWHTFREVFVIDPSETTRASLEHYPIQNGT